MVKTTLGAPLNTDNNAYAEIRQSRLFYSEDGENNEAQNYFAENYDPTFGMALQLTREQRIDQQQKTLMSLKAQGKHEKYLKMMTHLEGSKTPQDRGATQKARDRMNRVR